MRHSGEPSAHEDESDTHCRLLSNALPKGAIRVRRSLTLPGWGCARPVAIARVLVHDWTL